MNPQAARKVAMRRELRAARAALSLPTRSSNALRAARYLLRMPRLRRARRIAVYLSAGSELDTAPLIAALHALRCQVFVPVLDAGFARVMHMTRLHSGAALRARGYGIREPVRRLRAARRARIEIAVLPLLGFDALGHRLGSGGGYYDRWLTQQRPRPFCVGYACAMQEVAEIPAEHWDQALDAVCTERGVRYFSKRH